MIRYAFASTAASTAVLALATTVAAHAAETNVVPVSDRMAADNQPLGVRAGSFLVIPKVDVDAEYNDNIYATTNNRKEDFVTSVKPEVDVQSNWSRHALNAVARGTVNRYANHDSEDTDDYLVGVDGRLDVLRDTSIGGGVSYAQDHEDRGDPNTPASAVKPTKFNTTTARLGAFRSLGRANARFDSEIKNYDYKDNFTDTGALIDNNVRDRTHYTQTLRLGYQLTDVFEPYVKGSIENRVYDHKDPINRSSTGYNAVVGTTVDLTGKTQADAFAGYTRRNFETGMDDVSQPIYGLGLTWNATDLTTVKANIDRTVEETVLTGSSAYVRSAYSVGVEHALTRRLLATGSLEYADHDYKGTASDQRQDDIWTAALGAKYYLNKCFAVGSEYRFHDQNSNQVGGDYSRNEILVNLSATY